MKKETWPGQFIKQKLNISQKAGIDEWGKEWNKQRGETCSWLLFIKLYLL